MSVSWRCAVSSVVVSCSLFAGCTSAGADSDTASTSEPLLSLHASVLYSDYPLSQALVPALTFTPFVTNWGHSEFIVSGEHQGTLQRAFSLQVYDAPPTAALNTMTKGEPLLAVGGITLVSPDHPARLDWQLDATTGRMEVCADDGECGEPVGDACAGLAADSCLGTLVPGKNWGNHGISGRYLILYLASPAAAGSVYSHFFAQGQALGAGYHVIRQERVWNTLDASAQLANLECQKRAWVGALAQFNADHGTDYTDSALISDGGAERNVQLLADWDGAMIASSVAEGCVLPGAQQVIAEPDAETPLDLVLVGL